MTQERKRELLEWAKSEGFTDGTVVPADRMSFRTEFRAACAENRCGSYGKYWTCPPGAGEPETLIAKAQSFEWMLLLDYTHPLEDCFDSEGMGEGSRIHGEISQNLALHAAPHFEEPYLVMGHAACKLCEKCSYPDAPCRHPDLAVVSMSSYCVFVGETVRNSGLSYYTGEDSVHFFTAILFGRKNS